MAEGIVRRNGKRGPTYQAWVYDARTKRKKKRSFKSLAEARRWRRDALIEVRHRGLGSTSDPTVAEYADQFVKGMEAGTIRDRNERVYKPSTVRSYERALDLGVIPALGGLRLSEVTVQDVRGLVRLLRAEGLSDSTVRNRLDPLRSMYRHALDEDLVDFNPTAGLRLPNKRKEPYDPSFTFGEVADLIEAVRPADRALWATAFYAGLRRGELRALRVSDLDFDGGKIRVRRSWDQVEGVIPPKTESGVRDVFILDALRSYLTDHLIETKRGGDDLVFGRTAQDPFVPSSVGNRAKTDWKRAGLDGTCLQEARHMFASFALASGEADLLALKKAAGHSSVTTTLSVYGHLLPGREDEVRDAMNEKVKVPERVKSNA